MPHARETVAADMYAMMCCVHLRCHIILLAHGHMWRNFTCQIPNVRLVPRAALLPACVEAHGICLWNVLRAAYAAGNRIHYGDFGHWARVLVLRYACWFRWVEG